MSRWTHAICDVCWTAEQKANRLPALAGLTAAHGVLDPDEPSEYISDPCCYCAASSNGLYVRRDPAELWCKGEKGKHEGEMK